MAPGMAEGELGHVAAAVQSWWRVFGRRRAFGRRSRPCCHSPQPRDVRPLDRESRFEPGSCGWKVKLLALSESLKSAAGSQQGRRSQSRFWQYAPEIPAADLDRALGELAEEIEGGVARPDVRYDLVLFHLLRTRLTGVHGNRLWPEVASALWKAGPFRMDGGETAARFFRAQLLKYHQARLGEISEQKRFLCLAFDEAGVGYNRLDSIKRFLEFSIKALPNPVERASASRLSKLVDTFTARDSALVGLETTLLHSIRAVLALRTSLAEHGKLFSSRFWTFEELAGFAEAEAGIDLEGVIPEARDAFLHAFQFGSHGTVTQAEIYRLQLRRECKVQLPPARVTSPLSVPLGPARLSTEDGKSFDVHVCTASGADSSEVLGATTSTVVSIGCGSFLVDRSATVKDMVRRGLDFTPVYSGRSIDSAVLDAILLRQEHTEVLEETAHVFTRGISAKSSREPAAEPAFVAAEGLSIRGQALLEDKHVRAECRGRAAITFLHGGTFEMDWEEEGEPPNEVWIRDHDGNSWRAVVSFSGRRAEIDSFGLKGLGIRRPGFYWVTNHSSGRATDPIVLVLGDRTLPKICRTGEKAQLQLGDSGMGPGVALSSASSIGWRADAGISPDRAEFSIANDAATVTISWIPEVRDCLFAVGNHPAMDRIETAAAWHREAAFYAIGGPHEILVDGGQATLASVTEKIAARDVFLKARQAGAQVGTLSARFVDGNAFSRRWPLDIRPRARVLQCAIRRDGQRLDIAVKGEVAGPAGGSATLSVSRNGLKLATWEVPIADNPQPEAPLPFAATESIPSCLAPNYEELSVGVNFYGAALDVPRPELIGGAETPGQEQDLLASLIALLSAAAALNPEIVVQHVLDICLRSASVSGALPLSLEALDGRMALVPPQVRASIMFVLFRIEAFLRRASLAPIHAIPADILKPAGDAVLSLELLTEIARSSRGLMDPARVRRLAGRAPAAIGSALDLLRSEALAISQGSSPEWANKATLLPDLRASFGFCNDALGVLDRRYKLTTEKQT